MMPMLDRAGARFKLATPAQASVTTEHVGLDPAVVSE